MIGTVHLLNHRSLKSKINRIFTDLTLKFLFYVGFWIRFFFFIKFSYGMETKRKPKQAHRLFNSFSEALWILSLGIMLEVTLLKQRDWTRWLLRVPYNLSDSVILWTFLAMYVHVYINIHKYYKKQLHIFLKKNNRWH